MKEKQLLKGIGFTELEANVYINLLQEPGTTGYRVAKNLSKPVANTYKALNSLIKKGLLIAEENDKNKTFQALPINDYLSQMEKNFKKKRAEIEISLKHLNTIPRADGIYRLENSEQVYIKSGQIIENSEIIILVDAYPAPLERIKEDLEKKAQQGVKIYIKVYEPIDIKGCEIIENFGNEEDRLNWPCDWFSIVGDATQFLISFLKKENQGLYQAAWSQSPFLSLIIYSGYANEIILSRVENLLVEKRDPETVIKTLNELKKYLMHDKEITSKAFDIFNRINTQ